MQSGQFLRLRHSANVVVVVEVVVVASGSVVEVVAIGRVVVEVVMVPPEGDEITSPSAVRGGFTITLTILGGLIAPLSSMTLNFA